MGWQRRVKMYSIIFMLCLIGFCWCNTGSSNQLPTIVSMEDKDIDRKEFTQFCERGFVIRENREEVEESNECGVTEPGEFNHDEHLPVLFTLIMMVTWGATVRAVAKRFQIKTPYTVLLLLSGAVVGSFSHVREYCPTLHKYTAIARISPKLILYTFLPILIFESAYSISVHTFIRSFPQILILAVPGMLMSTFGTALICYQFFPEYKWNFLVACLFGSIVSATDPVAVVAILRDLGVSEQLGVLIDGESLMNDGVAILLFDIFHEYLIQPGGEISVLDVASHVLLKFVKITLGGPIWGYMNGRLSIFWLGFVYNDAAVEISATICAAYVTYWSSESVLEVSGVMAVVVLGLTLSAERTVISPESEGPVHHFWEMLGYLANTVLFILVGIVISETSITHFDIAVDIPYLILLYIALHVVRFLMLLTFYPILRRFGYGMEWQNLMVIMWGGLRGAVGICLALIIYEDDHLCQERSIGPKILFHTAGIVLLTLVINGTTTKGLLQTLKLTDVTVGQKEEMNNAVRRIKKVKWNTIRSFQMSKEMGQARWGLVDSICHISNPYAIKNHNEPTIDSRTLQPPRPIKDNSTVCWHCSNIVENEPTIMEYRNMTNDARLRAIKSMKIHYLHMFEKGTLTEIATQLLLADAEQAEDKYLQVIHASNFHKYMKAHGFYVWLRDKVIVKFNLYKEESVPEPPKARWRQPYYRIMLQEWFEALCFMVTIFNTISVVWDFALNYLSEFPSDPCKWTTGEGRIKLVFEYANYVFVVFYTTELIIRFVGSRLKVYFYTIWNYVDMVVLTVSYVDMYVDITKDFTNPERCKNIGAFDQWVSILRALRLIQFTRSIRLLRPLVLKVLRKIRTELNMQVFIGYDMGKGFVETSDAVIKFIPQIAENKKVQQVLKTAMKRERNACVSDLALLHTKYPGVVVALKTRHACRASINKMKIALAEIRDGGLLDDPECLLLKRLLEEKIRRLTHSPTYIAPQRHHSVDHGLHFHQEDETKGSRDMAKRDLKGRLTTGLDGRL